MESYSDVLKKYIGSSGKLTRFKGEYHRFRVAFNVAAPDLLKEMRQKGVELYTLVEVGTDFVVFQSNKSKVYFHIHTLVLED